MANETPGYFWRGPVTDGARARQIVQVAGAAFLGIGAVLLASPLSLISDHQDMSEVIAVMVLGAIMAGPGGLLLIRRDRGSALLMLVTALLLEAFWIAVAILASMDRDIAGLVGTVFAVACAVLVLLAWRAWKASALVARIRTDERAATRTSQAFD